MKQKSLEMPEAISFDQLLIQVSKASYDAGYAAGIQKRLQLREGVPSESIFQILLAIEGYFGLTLDEMKAKVRKRAFVTARHVTCFLLRKYGDVSFQRIADIFDQDHTTVMNACNTIKDLQDAKDDKICKALDSIEKEIIKELKIGAQ